MADSEQLAIKRVDQGEFISVEVQERGDMSRPGDLFGFIILSITGLSPSNCSTCLARKKQMNDWGWWGCFRNKDTIVEWLVEEARKRGHTIDKANAWELLQAAFKEFGQKFSLPLQQQKE